jgi:hypothetical protein
MESAQKSRCTATCLAVAPHPQHVLFNCSLSHATRTRAHARVHARTHARTLTHALQFPTVNEHYDGNFSAALRQLAQPVKLKLQALSQTAPQDGVLGVVGIESLAPLHIVDNFIHERLNPAAAAGPASAAAAKSHKFNLYLNGCPLDHTMPIIRAIVTSSSSTPAVPTRTMSGSGSKSGGASSHAYDAQHPTWSQIHTIHFEPRPDESPSEMGAAASDDCRLQFLDYASAHSSACSLTECSQDIQGEWCASVCRSLVALTPRCAGALSLLQAIHSISQSFFTLHQHTEAHSSAAAGAVMSLSGFAPPLLHNDQFICEKLRLKIMRQISDPIVVCSRDFPQWLAVVGQELQFLLPCECRSAMLHSMSFNVYRSLHYIVAKYTDASADVRVSRIPRQQVRDCPPPSPCTQKHFFFFPQLSPPQVRVSRTRIVSCARKVVEQLAHVAGIVEIEFYGEVGTGLGPTLEFYSLLALELQAAHLGMWRCPATVTRAELFPDGTPCDMCTTPAACLRCT